MNLYAKLRERDAQGKPLRVGLIGAGKFGAMYLAQVPKTPGVHLVGIADLSPANAQDQPASASAGTPSATPRRRSMPRSRAALDARRRGLAGAGRASAQSTSSSKPPAIRSPRSSTRSRRSGTASTWSWSRSRPTRCAARCWRERARAAGVVYSLAYGDQPALICDLVDWARAAGFQRRGGRPRPQVAAAFRAVHAGDGVGLLRAHAGAGEDRRPQSEDVQFLPRRLEARHREHCRVQCHRADAGAGRPALSAGQRRRHPDRDAPARPRAATCTTRARSR